jgi:SAM-dependent methyltransferase
MDEEQVWDDLVAAPWIRHGDVVDGQSHRFGAAAMDRLDPLAGATVLDVGCGLGTTTWALAERTGPEGSVTGVDLSEPFVRTARARGHAPNVTFVVADAATVDLPPFDALYSRFGVMFFPDPVAAFTHLRALTRPGGRLAFACWQEAGLNPWMLEPVIAAVPVLGPPQLPPPGAPGPFAFGDAAVVRGVLEGAGWSDVEIDGLQVEQPYPAGDARQCAEVMVQLAPPLAAGLREAPEKRDEVVAAIADQLRTHEREGQVVLDAAAWIVTARA